MKRNRMSKLSVSLIVLIMAMSALVLLPSDGGTGQTVKTNVVEVPVQDSDGYFVVGATVDLTNVHTGAAIRATPTTPGLYHADDVPAGVYRIDVVAGEYYDNHTMIVNFTAYTSIVTPTVKLQEFDTKSFTWAVNVKSAATANAIQGATVGFYDCIRNETVASSLTDKSGNANVTMFQTQPSERFVLFVKASTYNTTYEEMVVSGSGTRNINLAASKRVSGIVRNWEGTTTLKNVVGYMLSKDTSLPLIARMPQSPSSSGSFEFDAFPGQFIMVVDADNGSAYVQEITIQPTGSYSFDDFRLRYQVQRTEDVSVAFGANYQSFTLGVSTTWSYDQSHPAMLYSNMGSLRLQIDLALGDGDGSVSQSEVDRFNGLLATIGSQYVTSSGLLKVNGSLYDPGAVTGNTVSIALGSVVSEDGVSYAYSCVYSPHTAVPVGGSYYNVDFTARYDVYAVNYQYAVTPATGYELVYNESNSLVQISGYLSVTVQPLFVVSGGSQDVTMRFDKSEAPTAKAGIRDDANAEAIYDDLNVTRYLVALNENVTLTASGSTDPNMDNPIEFTWDFGDGGSATTSSETTVHKFTSIARFTVNLTVTDVAGLQDWSEITVDCDGLSPTPVITVKDRTPVANSIAVGQRETIWFNATNSYDDAITAGDKLGVIDYIQFDWDDGNVSTVIQGTATQQNVSHAWERSGSYTILLNVTDVVGHVVNTTMTVVVNDTEAPAVQFTVLNETWNATYIENTTLYFDATSTLDLVDPLADLNFSWNFADGTWINLTGTAGANVTHLFASTGDFRVSLNVTDKSGNYDVENRLITVLSGSRPNVWIERVYYNPSNFTEGKSGLILVNVTNKGSEPATNLDIKFYIVLGDGTQKEMSGSGSLYDVNGTPITVIEVGQKAQYRFSYEPGSKGTFIIRVNVTCDDQLRPYSFTARDDSAMQVNEAAWKQWALWGGVIAIIVLIPLLLMLRGRLAKREKKGPRRERKEKEKVSDEEL